MAKKQGLKEYTALGNISAKLILKNFPFVLFLGFMATVYIANANFAEKQVRNIQHLQEELKELRWHYMALKSEIMFKSKRSEVTESVKDLGLRPRREKPKKIVVEPE